MNRHWIIGAVSAPFVLIAHALAYDVSITPGTGGLGLSNPVSVPVPEPNAAILFLIGLMILGLLSILTKNKMHTRKTLNA